MKVSMIGFLSFLAAASALAGQGEVKVNVSLTPAGSFVAQSNGVEVKGFARKQGAQLLAQNIVLDLDSLSTGISLRDKHMKEKYFETGKPNFKNAILSNATGKDGQFSGDLTLHGVTKKISGTYEINGGKFNGKFKTKVSDFGIAQAKYMGVGVDDDVEVEISLPEAGVGAAPVAAPPAAAKAPAKAPAKAAPKKK